MGEHDTDREGAAGAGEEGEEDTAEGDTEESSTEEGADDASDDGTDDEGDGNEPDDAEGADGKGKGKKDDGDEPPVRKPKTAADFVALRRGKKIEKISGKGKGGDKGGADDDGDEDEDGLAPEDADAIDRRIAKALAPLVSETEQKEVDSQIADFVTSNPEFKPYAAKVAKWAGHEAYKNVAIEQIFYAAAGKELLRIGATKGKKADGEARKGRTGGGSDGGGDGASKDWHGASHEDVGKEIERIKMGGK